MALKGAAGQDDMNLEIRQNARLFPPENRGTRYT